MTDNFANLRAVAVVVDPSIEPGQVVVKQNGQEVGRIVNIDAQQATPTQIPTTNRLLPDHLTPSERRAQKAIWAAEDLEESGGQIFNGHRPDHSNGYLHFEAAHLLRQLAAHQQATPEPDDDDKWRDVAHRFDKHRMQALWHLQAMLQDPVKHADIVRQFLKDPTHPVAATPEPVGEVALLVAEILSLADEYAEAEAKAGGLAGCGGDIGQQHELDEDAAYIKGRLTGAVNKLSALATRPVAAPAVPEGFALVPLTPGQVIELANKALPGWTRKDNDLSYLEVVRAAEAHHAAALAAAQAKGGE